MYNYQGVCTRVFVHVGDSELLAWFKLRSASTATTLVTSTLVTDKLMYCWPLICPVVIVCVRVCVCVCMLVCLPLQLSKVTLGLKVQTSPTTALLAVVGFLSSAEHYLQTSCSNGVSHIFDLIHPIIKLFTP